MGSKHEALIGTTLGLLTIEAYIPGVGGVPARFRVHCSSCGGKRETAVLNVIHRAHTQKRCACGRRKANATAEVTAYHCWQSMIQRCTNPNNAAYDRYGGKGIKVCDAWRRSYDTFINSIGPRPSLTHSIDRIDGERDYEPGNVRWATKKEQANNRSVTTLVTAFGKTQSLKEWAEELGVKYATLRGRVSRVGWDVEKALTIAVGSAEAKAAAPPRKRTNRRKRFSDMVGETFGRLTIEQYIPGKRTKKPPARFVCRCACSNSDPVTVSASALTYGQVASCGCLATERVAAFNRSRSKTYTAFGEEHTLMEWAILKNMDAALLRSRVSRGVNLETALTNPKDPRGSYARPQDGDAG